jgi:4-hydroxy-L-threonine phosphate dehydrogenase PdxA
MGLPFIKFSPQMATAFEAAYCGARKGGLNE